MGCKFSSNSTTSLAFENVRVVQVNGYVEHFDYPVSVSELTAKLPKHFVCTHSQLLSPCPKPLLPSTYLEPGQIYFLLPFSFFQAGFSPADLAGMARKLSNVAKSNNRSTVQSGNTNLSCASPVWKSPASNPSRFPETHRRIGQELVIQRSTRTETWKPILSTIREISFNRRSESDLEEKGLEGFGQKESLQIYRERKV